MKPIGLLNNYDCSNCQALCCVATGRKGLPDVLSLGTGHPCPNITSIGDCVSCSVHNTIATNKALRTCHAFDCLSLGNRLSDIMKRAGVHWMKDTPLPTEKKVIFDNIVYYFDVASMALSFFASIKKLGLHTFGETGIKLVEQLLADLDTDCQKGVPSQERLVDFWLQVMQIANKVPQQLLENFLTIKNTITLFENLINHLNKSMEQIQPGLSAELQPVLQSYAFAYATITLVEVAIHGKKFEESFHQRAVQYVCRDLGDPMNVMQYTMLLNSLYTPITLGFEY